MIKIKNLSCGYNGKNVINDISADIKKGSFTGIIGKNGTGKTTLLKSIAGLLKPYKGNILIDGKDIYKASKSFISKRLAFMPQSMQTDFSFTVKDFIMFGRYPYMNIFKIAKEQDYKIVDEIMTFTDTLQFKDKNINELSGGEKQKVIMAQTLCQKTDIIALDEPTSHLDIGSQGTIFKLLRKINKEYGTTIVTTIHDLNIAGEFCSDLIFLDDGKIFNYGSADKVLNYMDIEKVYKTTVVIKTNPISEKPVVIPVYTD